MKNFVFYLNGFTKTTIEAEDKKDAMIQFHSMFGKHGIRPISKDKYDSFQEDDDNEK